MVPATSETNDENCLFTSQARGAIYVSPVLI